MISPSYYRNGDLSRMHSDCRSGRISAFILNLSKNFQSNNGGAFVACDQQKLENTTKYETNKIAPNFNSATFMFVMPRQIALSETREWTYQGKTYKMGEEILPGIKIYAASKHFVETVNVAQYSRKKRLSVHGYVHILLISYT